MLHKIKPLRPGTVRYSISGVPGIADDDRAVVSVWPHPSGAGLAVMVTIDGSVNVRQSVHLEDATTPAKVDSSRLHGIVGTMVAAVGLAKTGSMRPQG